MDTGQEGQVGVVETWAEGLEGQAKLIVESESLRQCVQPGPGTGKSFCMTRRLLRLIEQRHVRPSEVLAVTFTRTAATDLRKSLEKDLGSQNGDFHASTLHSLCFGIVTDENFLRTRGRHPRFLLTATKSGCMNFEAAPMLADLKQENSAYEGARKQSHRIREYEAMWTRKQEDPLGAPGNSLDAMYGTSLLNWLRFHRGMMVGELVKEAYEFMSAEPDTQWRSKFRAILVDEYQDLNKLDQVVIELLSEHPETLCSVVGDLDQSIYSFRCAHPDGLREYALKTGVESMTMEVSRRCPTSHLRAAQSLIRQNTNNAGMYPIPKPNMHVGEISVRRWNNRSDEVRGVVSFIQDCMVKGVEPRDVLVMVPSRVIGKDIKMALRTAGIEAHSYFAEEQLEEEPAQRAFTLLSLLANPKDRVSLRCWLGGWSNGYRSGSYRHLRRYCEVNGTELSETLDRVVAAEIFIPNIDRLADSYKELLTKLEGLKDLLGNALLDAVFPPTEDWTEDIRNLLGESVSDDVTPSILHEQLADLITQPVMPTEVSHVRVMSLHKSKGLTAKAAVIAGSVEGLLPRPYDPVKSFLTESEHLEEQRRLLYVAMTRSTDYLLISSSLLVGSKFEFGPEIPGSRQSGGFRMAVSSFVTGLGVPNLPPATNATTFP